MGSFHFRGLVALHLGNGERLYSLLLRSQLLTKSSLDFRFVQFPIFSLNFCNLLKMYRPVVKWTRKQLHVVQCVM